MGEAPTLPGEYRGRRRLEWPVLIRAFAAPALFTLIAAAVAGAIISNANAAERLRTLLADFGIEVSQDEREAASGPRFKGLTALQSLNLRNMQIVDLAPLESLTALRLIDLSETQVADLASLKGLTALQSLDLSETEIADLAPLKGLTALQSLDLRGAPVADLAPLKSLTALQSLNIWSTHVADLAPLQDLPNLGVIRGVRDDALQTLNAYQSAKRLPVIKAEFE